MGPFTHYPSTLEYLSYSTNPPLGVGGWYASLTVTTNWKAYPAQVQYKLDSENYKTVTTNLANTTARMSVPITSGSHTLYFSESSSQQTKLSWYLSVPVDNTPTTYTTSMQYDAYGNVTSVTDPESNTTSLTYSSSYSYAYMTEVSTTVGSDTITTKATYDSYRGWITSIQQPKGVAAGSGYDYLYTYDLLGRVTKKEFPLLAGQQERSYLEAVYDDTNRIVTLIDPLRHYVVKQFDKLGRLASVKSYTGTYGSGTLYATITYAYRYDDLVSSATDPGTHQTTYSYDFLGRVTQITLPDSSSISYTYDDLNNKVTITNARGYDRIHWFDWLSHLKKVEEEYAADTFAVTTYQYDEIGHLTSFTDGENHVTTYTYASPFGPMKTTYADSTFEQYAYDNVGNVTTLTDGKGNDTIFTHDDLYRLVQIEYEDTTTVSFTYDLNSNRIRMTDNALSAGDYVEYTYDAWNRILSETRHISTDSYALSYQYDVASRVTKMTYPDSMQILYSYDDLNRITEIKRYVDGSNDEILMEGVQYNMESLLTQFDYGNDLRATFSYDSRHRISTIDVKDGQTSLLDLDFTFDNNTNITQLVNGWRDTDSDWHSETESYSYDGVDRLTSASCTSWSHTYSYDKVGNRTAKDSVTYTINTVNEITALSDGTSFTYDDNGNRAEKSKGTDAWSYTYDYANRLTKVKKNSSTVGEYVYDGDGRRMQTTENGLTTTSIYVGMIVAYEKTSSGHADYVYGLSELVAKRTTMNNESHTYFYHNDHLSSTRLVTDEGKNIIVAAAYEPFGESSVKEGEEDYLFNGKEKDTTGLYYYGARYYDPDTGRFITKDLLGGLIWNPKTLNRFSYCYNNPLSYREPDGRNPAKIEGGGCDCPFVPPPVGDRSIINAATAGITLYSAIFALSNPVGLAIDTALFLLWVLDWLDDLANNRVFTGQMDTQQEGYLPIYGNEPEWCTVIIKRDSCGQPCMMVVYDSQGNLVGLMTLNENGEVIGGWMMVNGRYRIYNPETGQWEDAPNGWEPEDPGTEGKPGTGTSTMTSQLCQVASLNFSLALSLVNLQSIRASFLFRLFSQAVVSFFRLRKWDILLLLRHSVSMTPISISAMLSQLP